MAKTLIIPSNPKDIERIKKAVKEASDCYIRIESEKEELKAIAEVINEELEVPKAVFNKMVRIYHKQNFDTVIGDMNDFEEFYSKVMA